MKGSERKVYLQSIREGENEMTNLWKSSAVHSPFGIGDSEDWGTSYEEISMLENGGENKPVNYSDHQSHHRYCFCPHYDYIPHPL